MSDPTSGAGPSGQDRERRERLWSRNGAWVGGVILVGLGLLLLLENLGVRLPDNWWAIFLLIPAGAALSGALSMYRQDRAMTPRVISAGIGGLVLVALGIAFLAGFDWGVFWPVILIALGLAVLLGGFRRG